MTQLTDKNELAIKHGLSSYDCALPQPWLDAQADNLAHTFNRDRDECYHRILSGTVWCYDPPYSTTFGAPYVFDETLQDELTIANLENDNEE